MIPFLAIVYSYMLKSLTSQSMKRDSIVLLKNEKVSTFALWFKNEKVSAKSIFD